MIKPSKLIKELSLSPEIKQQYFYNNIGAAYAKNKQFNEAQAAFTAYENLFPEEGRTYRNWAMYYSIIGEKDQALAQLQKAINLGYDDVNWIRTDDSLESIRKEKDFRKILFSLEQKKQ